jgi:hypothetical protein
MLTSIVVPPLPNAPFSATVNTEWTRSLENGATMIFKNHRLIARDAHGPIFHPARDRRNARGVDGERLNLMTKRMDPRNGVELFTLTDINLSEPDPGLFALPKGVRIVDNRTPVPPR